MGTRKTNRKALVTLLDADATFTQVNGYKKSTLAGASKVLNVYSETSRLDDMSANYKDDFYTFFIDSLVIDDGTEDTEDDLDDMQAAIRSVIKTNHRTANWSELDLTGSRAFYSELEGKRYRVEQHRVEMKVSNTS